MLMYVRSKIIDSKKLIYFGLKIENSGQRKRQRKRIKAKRIQTLTAIDKCLLKVLNTNVKFWKTYEIGESKMLYGVEIWTVKGGWKYTDGIHGGFFLRKS